MATSLNNLPDFDKLWNYSKPDETEKQFRTILDSLQSESAPDYTAQLLTQIARCEVLQMKFDKAHKTLDQAEKMINEDMTLPTVRLLLERGRVFNSSGNPTKSAPLFLKAWEIARDANLDFYAVDAAHMLGIVLEPEDALTWNERACQLAEASDNQQAKNWLGALYNNIGWTYHSKGDYQTALDFFQKDEKWYAEREMTTQMRIARWSAAKMQRLLGETAIALATQFELEKILQAINEQDGYIFEEIAECLYALGKESKDYFHKAFELLSKDAWLVRDEPQRLERLNQLGK